MVARREAYNGQCRREFKLKDELQLTISSRSVCFNLQKTERKKQHQQKQEEKTTQANAKWCVCVSAVYEATDSKTKRSVQPPPSSSMHLITVVQLQSQLESRESGKERERVFCSQLLILCIFNLFPRYSLCTLDALFVLSFTLIIEILWFTFSFFFQCRESRCLKATIKKCTQWQCQSKHLKLNLRSERARENNLKLYLRYRQHYVIALNGFERKWKRE